MIRSDLLYLARYLRRSWTSAAAAVLTLALTLGAGTSILSVFDAVVLQPLPFRDPEALVILAETPMNEPTAVPRRVGYATFQRWVERAAGLAVLEAFEGTNLTLTGLGAAERVRVNDISPGLLGLLGSTTSIGRGFESREAGAPVVMLSHAFWRGKLGADPGIIGEQIMLGGVAHTVVGVLPEQFRWPLDPADLWRPLPFTPAQASGDEYRVSVVARIRQDASPATLVQVLDDVSRSSSPPTRVVATPITTAFLGSTTMMLGLVAGSTTIAILIAFANLAGLLLVRSIDRRRELAVRTALGAGRFEVLRQLLLEAQALVAFGLVAGTLLALWFTPAMASLALQLGGVAAREVEVSGRVLAIVGVAASIGGWACAALSARLAGRPGLLSGPRQGLKPSELRVRSVLVTVEVALAFVLLASVTMLGTSLLRLLAVQAGFDARGVLTLQVSVPAATYDRDRVISFYSTLHGALEQRLGAGTTAIVNEVPLSGSLRRALVSTPGDIAVEAVLREAGPGYFDVMGIPIRSGTTFEPRAHNNALPRVVLSESLSERLFGSDSPVGREIRLSGEVERAEIIGVVGDVTHRTLDEMVQPTLYFSVLEVPSRSNILVVRSPRPEADVLIAVREEVGRLDASVPVYGVRPMEEVVASSSGMPVRRIVTATFVGLAVLSLVLAAVGLFGVVAHDVASRRSELALRLALGADPTHILATALGRSTMMLVTGLAAGGLLSIVATRSLNEAGLASDSFDLMGFGLPAVVLAVTAAIALLPAARRAMATDPLTSLRSE